MTKVDRILLPPRYRTWTRGAWHLYFDPFNFTWVRVNDTGRFILERLARYRTLQEIAQEATREFGVPPEQAERVVDSFADELIDSGFLHRNSYEERERIEFGQRKFPFAVYLHLTNNCNLRCSYCYNRSDRTFKLELQKKGRFAPILTTQELSDVIARLIELDVRHLIFTGGEPLMREDALDLMELARRQGGERVTLEVLTNGILLKEPVVERLCDLVDGVTISVDGHRREDHEKQRGKNTFTPTVRGIKTLAAARRRRGQDRPRITIVPALTDENVGSMKEVFEFALDELGADGLAPIIFQAGDHQELSLDQIPRVEEWIAAQERAGEYLKQRNAGAEKEPRKPRPVVPRRHCGASTGELSIDPSGFVYPCQSLHFDDFLCGNVRERDLQEIFDSSPIMQQVRSTAVERIPVCRQCDLKYLCNGGCRATAYNVYKDFAAHDEVYCEHLAKLAMDGLWASSDMPLVGDGHVCV